MARARSATPVTPAASAATADSDDRGASRDRPARKTRSRSPRRCRARSSPSTCARATRCASGQQLFVMEAMKMEHVIRAPIRAASCGRSRSPSGDAVFEGHPLAFIEEAEVEPSRPPRPRKSTSIASAPTSPRCTSATRSASTPRGPTRSRAGARPVSAPRARTSTTCATRAPSSSTAPLVIAAQRRRRALEDLIKNTPGRRAGRRHRPRQRRSVRAIRSAQCVVMSYDYTVLAGTQGQQNHRKKDRMFELAAQSAPAGGVLHRGRRRTSRRHRRPRASPGLDCLGVQLLGQAERPGAAGRHQLGPLLRRQRGAARMLRRRHRDRETRTSGWAVRR